MKILDITAQVIRLPFRFSFKHSLASRNFSDNILVCVRMESDNSVVTGYGESIPRDYVTGEDTNTALSRIRTEYVPRFSGQTYEHGIALRDGIWKEFLDLELDKQLKGASWCALETALLDAAGQAEQLELAELIGTVRPVHRGGIRYGAVIPFGNKRAFTAVAWFYRLFGFGTVKIKVGRDFETDLDRIALARKILGPEVVLRADANCAWSADEALRCAEKFRPFKVASYEQPVAADDLDGLARVARSIPEQVLADESLCSIEQARVLAHDRICTAFNIRISKVGGVLAAGEIARIATQAGIARHMGAQVGESGILSAAGRSFASTEESFDNYEGSNNLFLLKTDITSENLNVGPGGIGKLLKGPGLGVTVIAESIAQVAQSAQQYEAHHDRSDNPAKVNVQSNHPSVKQASAHLSSGNKSPLSQNKSG